MIRILTKARQEVEKVKTEIAHFTTELNRLGRLSQALPLLSQRRAIFNAIAAMGDVPKLPDDFSESRRRATTMFIDATAAAADIEQQINQATGS